MPWRYVTRSELVELLKEAESAPAGVERLRRWLREFLSDAELELHDGSASLIHAAVQRLDVAGGSDSTLKELAVELHRLLRAVPDDDAAKDLISVIEERDRTVDVLEGALAQVQREQVLALHRNAQRLLEPIAVVNPYAPQLAFSDAQTRTRRDHEKYLTLIDAIALLHQHQRARTRSSATA